MFQGLQRIKGAIDSRIAEEQARQRAAVLSASPSRSGAASTRRNLAQDESSTRRPSRQRAQNDLSSTKSPDPAEFEADFVIGDDESAAASGTATPIPEAVVKNPDVSTATQEKQGVTSTEEDTDVNEEKPHPTPALGQHPDELPIEVRVRLRKLDRLESKYEELLKAYRTAHARVQLIERFETSLKENTPLISINDPRALVEYLNQINLKGNLVVDELKRVTGERDDFKKKYQKSEEAVSQLQNDISSTKVDDHAAASLNGIEVEKSPRASLEGFITVVCSGALETQSSIKSPTPSASSRVPSFSLFSPKAKAAKSPVIQEKTEEFFSYDSEIPRLEAQLAERQTEIESLTKQVETLKGDLSVTRESTESMVQSLEIATRELHGLRDAKDKFEITTAELRDNVATLKGQLDEAEARSAVLQKQVTDLEEEIKISSVSLEDLNAARLKVEEENGAQKAIVIDTESKLTELRERLAQKEATVKDLEDSLAMAKSAERQELKSQETLASKDKKLETMQKSLDAFRAQFDSAEKLVADLKSELKQQQEAFQERPSSKLFTHLDPNNELQIGPLTSREDAVAYLKNTFGVGGEGVPTSSHPLENNHTATPEAEVGPAAKKKNKKKKKSKAGQVNATDSIIHEAPVKVTEDLGGEEDEMRQTLPVRTSTSKGLEEQIARLQAQLTEKDATIERLQSRLKDQDDLREEIETLRDDLLHQGQEHVEARDALKTAHAEKTALKVRISTLERELEDGNIKAGIWADAVQNAEQARKDLETKFEELRLTSHLLQTDLNAAEQLAAARFKDITDLRELLSKAQPELRSLRSEVQDLKNAKDDLQSRTGELKRLELRLEDLKSEVKGFAKRLSDKDTEVKDLQKKVEQETAARSKAEEDLHAVKSDLETTETRRLEAEAASTANSVALAKSKDELLTTQSHLRDLEAQLLTHTRQIATLSEDLSLKTSLHASSQTLLAGLRSQTHELSAQAREASTRADSLEEEVADAQRMLSERSRESETMRWLIAEAEAKAEARVRDMKERMESAVEERDRVEDEASTSARRTARELEDAKTKARDASKASKVAEEEREELERQHNALKKRSADLEAAAEKAQLETTDVRAAMAQLRDALDASEARSQVLERQRADVRRTADDAHARIEKLARANKILADEVQALQAPTAPKARIRPGAGGRDSGVQSSRSSVDVPTGPPQRSGSVTGSPAPPPGRRSETPTGPNAGGPGVDLVYLKNVLLQFLEQRDKTHQKQLIPVLGMLLHFDRTDEQKWTAAITTR